jgi:hypothetical protein
MLDALLLVALAAIAAVAVLVWRRRMLVPVGPATEATPGVAASPEPKHTEPAPPPKPRAHVLAEAVPARATISGVVAPPSPPRPVLIPSPPPAGTSSDTLDTLDALLAELESATVRIDGADAFDEESVTELEGLAARLEAAAESIAAR